MNEDFFRARPTEIARLLIGATLTHGTTSGLIVETEAYSEINDEACHTFIRRHAREFVEKHAPGTAYIYLNYGVYWLANILVQAPDGERGFVLIRALEPLTGIELMKERRKKSKLTDLCSGPGKLSIALGIGPEHHEQDFRGKPFTLSPRSSAPEILTGPRIGISKATELPWRYGLADSPHLSRPFP
ncbi:DNA-3-methyladenine glycosylase [Roseibacillus persicicus]|uniref:Putative 3-methyladenine DNA glycosylase n=1 Tax=Roseibacillus persicicus TaxID=454148 RepID=A0A918TG75_9BACT|nr:DNA-3-methyladenine glycosylase [Roseibacillus persicicus]GHC43716.1 putative 3-methyladenine DNA glycosylase [Roseibacillus persicicus]